MLVYILNNTYENNINNNIYYVVGTIGYRQYIINYLSMINNNTYYEIYWIIFKWINNIGQY